LPVTEHEAKLLMALKERAELPMSKIRDAAGIGSPGTVQLAVSRLVAMGLLEERFESGFPRRHTVKLTRFGLKAAEHLQQIEEQLAMAEKLAKPT
jgi:DNA-binding MarR family transcriptional regulator